MIKHLPKTLIAASILATSSAAIACPCSSNNDNEVTLPLTAHTWVKSQTAKVIVELNASIKDKQVLHLPNHLHKTLHKLADQQWHVTHCDKDSDKSGLNKIVIDAQTRLNNEAILKLKQQLKDVSEAGMTYHLKKVDYQPSFKQLQTNRASLRQSIYKQAQQEVDTLKSAYTKKNPHIQSINFMPGLMQKGNHPNPRQLNTVQMMGVNNQSQHTPSAAFPISQRLKQKAVVKIKLNS